ncbi:DUF4136 domain-containing protein [Leeuwenhoekiella palythoae]|uniref:DUF4136 domain-containing protein n=1 Tax=Leeuwenhoekiella palythoae TaxID=573501 RepID=A0A1M5ZC29_9FLAO|nr:DUF4136 domain-containing protein [Leeuwenhoekiella palythoae]RXG28065.1 putative protein DUF4136 [Leeuwenhoekiella palythoae]SHI21463.1 protein of unknown function [Leeuwenhoekiella palythoae]
MKHFFIFVLAVVAISCGSTRVDYDYDEQIDFSQYQTYNFMPEMDSGLSQLDLKRLMDATDAVMQAKGFTKSQTPDVLINIIAEEYEDVQRNSVGVGIGGGSYGGGVSVGAGIPLGGNKNHQTITLDLVDAQKDILVWQAVSDSNIKVGTNPQERVTHYTKIAQKIFEKFPPEE